MADNADLAQVSGINTKLVVRVTWIIAGALACMAGTMLALDVNLKPDLAFNIVLPIFAAAIVGGLGQAYGAIAGGFLIGFAETLAIFNWTTLLRPLQRSCRSSCRRTSRSCRPSTSSRWPSSFSSWCCSGGRRASSRGPRHDDAALACPVRRPVRLFVVLGLVLGAANITLLLVQSFAYALIALGLNIQWGYGGLFNFGIMGFMMLGGAAVTFISYPDQPRVLGLGRPADAGQGAARLRRWHALLVLGGAQCRSASASAGAGRPR
jgi:ABC-type branched-subunit amino acid transport system permease subunit